MSLTTIGILREQRKNMIELDPSSETFQIVGGGTFIGIFDDAYDMGSKDSGNVTMRSTCPAIMTAEEPAGLSKDVEILREDLTPFTWRRTGTDEEGIVAIWLY